MIRSHPTLCALVALLIAHCPFISPALRADDDSAPARLAELRALAAQNNAEAQNALGVMYEKGEGVDQSDTEAVAWYQKASDQKHAEAQDRLGSMYRQGRGVSRDERKAFELFRLSAAQKCAQGQCHLASMYERGLGVPQDAAKAANLYFLAAEQGDTEAQVNLGLMYQQGRGVKRSSSEARKWFLKAAEQGNEQAEAKLGALPAIPIWALAIAAAVLAVILFYGFATGREYYRSQSQLDYQESGNDYRGRRSLGDARATGRYR